MEFIRRTWICGRDEYYLHIRTHSHTSSDPTLIYDLTIDLRRGIDPFTKKPYPTGDITCNCKDSTMRRHRRYGNILEPDRQCCKHSMVVVREAQKAFWEQTDDPTRSL